MEDQSITDLISPCWLTIGLSITKQAYLCIIILPLIQLAALWTIRVHDDSSDVPGDNRVL